MRPTSFRPDALRALLLRNKIATLDDLKHALGTRVDVTVLRKLKPLDYLSSYSHRGRFYTLREIALFDDHGLWSRAEVWFSRFGTLLATAEAFVNRSPRGYFADELAPALHVEVQDALHQLAQQGRVSRQLVSGRYLYTATDPVSPTTTTSNAPHRGIPAHGGGYVRAGGSRPRKSKPPFCCSTVCSTSSSAGSMPDWSRSSWAVAATANWPTFSTWIRIPWPVGVNSY